MKGRILKLAIAAIFLAGATPLMAQNKIDAWLRDMITMQQEQPERLSQLPKRGLTLGSETSQAWVDIILKSESRDFSSVVEAGGLLRTVTGPYATAFVPLARVTELARRPHIDYIAPSLRSRTLNDRATAATGADDAVQAGFTGDDVLVGVIDTGIDIKHPGFIDDNGSRILYLWDQTQAGAGTANPGYDYGTEWTKQQIDLGQCTSIDEDGHGTHVAGSIAQFIATGPDSAYDGGAIEANLVIVKTDFFNTSILDGINYIFEKALQLGKPAIVNLSLGSQVGPHDGTDLIASAVDHLTGPGRIVVQAAGNDGTNRIHHQVIANVSGGDMAFSLERTAGKLEFELWHDGGSDVTVEIFAPGEAQPSIVSSGVRQRLSNSAAELTVDNAAHGIEPFNQDKRIAIKLDNARAGSWFFRLKSSIPTLVHAWMWNGDPDAGFAFTTDDNHYTLVNEACGRKVIAVGATVTRNRFRVRCLDGTADGTVLTTTEEPGTIATFSAGGPTRDERQKPDVVAPGSVIVSALTEENACGNTTPARDGDAPGRRAGSDDFRSIGPRYIFGGDPNRPAQKLHLLGVFQGTSMSTPVTSGSIVPLLENAPNTTPDGVREYIKSSSAGVASLNGNAPGSNNSAAWDYRAGYGLFDIRPFLNQLVPIVSSEQIADNMLDISFSFLPEGADNPANYEITGASAVTVLSATPGGSGVTLTLSGKLKEGFRDWVRIQGLQGIAEAIELEVEKIGTIIEFDAILTNEIWTPDNSPYYIHQELQVPGFATLTLQPGTVLKFMPQAGDPAQLVVFGRFSAQGTEQSPITFTSLSETEHGEWGGLAFASDIPATTLKYCRIQYAETGVVCFSSDLTLENCAISNSFNTGFLAQNCSPTLRRTTIWNSRGGEFDDGIQLSNASSATIIENVTVADNDRVGIACFSSNPQIINSIIIDNDWGVHSQEGPPPSVTYSNVWNNNIDYTGNAGPGTGAISANPMFSNSAAGDFRLLAGSPSIDAGNPAAQFNDADGTRNDMGALARLAELMSFSGSADAPGVRLDWQTIATNKVLGVLILRSSDGAVDSRPTGGVDYESGQQLGNATVVFSSQDRGHDGTTIDATAAPNVVHHYASWAKYDGNQYSAAALTDTAIIVETAVEAGELLPLTFAMQQNYPNPFNPETEIQFQLPKPSHVVVTVFNSLGQQVRELLNADYEPGSHNLVWDATDDSSQPVSSGVYLYQIRAGDFVEVRKMILLR